MRHLPELSLKVSQPVEAVWLILNSQLLIEKKGLKMAITEDAPTDFIREIVREDVKNGKHKKIVTRFPPRAKWLSAHRPCQGFLPGLWSRRRI